MLELYPDQIQSKSEIYRAWNSGSLRVMFGASTGSGKTVVAASIIMDAVKKDKVALFVVDMLQLCVQAKDYLESLGLNVSIYQGDNTWIHPDQQVIVASVQTLARRRRLPEADLIIIDEAHVFHLAHEDILSTYDNLLTLGLSATPMRRGLGLWFDTLVRSPSTKQLIEMNRLTPPVCFDPFIPDLEKIPMVGDDYNLAALSHFMNNQTIIGNIVDEWKKLGGNRQTVCFAVDIAHSQAIVRRFNDADVPALHLDAYTDAETRKTALERFEKKEIKILSSVGVLAKGFDSPIAGCAILARPTKSKMLYIQQIGRVLRKYPGKDNAIILDHSGNINRFGLPQRFKIPDLNSTLKKRQSSTSDEEEVKPVRCRVCTTLLEPIDEVCPLCGTSRIKDNTVIEIDGHLKRVEEKISNLEKENWYRQVIALCDLHKKKRGLAYYMYKDKWKEEPKLNCYRLRQLEEPTEKTKNWFKGHLIRRAKGLSKKNNGGTEVSLSAG